MHSDRFRTVRTFSGLRSPSSSRGAAGETPRPVSTVPLRTLPARFPAAFSSGKVRSKRFPRLRHRKTSSADPEHLDNPQHRRPSRSSVPPENSSGKPRLPRFPSLAISQPFHKISRKSGFFKWLTAVFHKNRQKKIIIRRRRRFSAVIFDGGAGFSAGPGIERNNETSAAASPGLLITTGFPGSTTRLPFFLRVSGYLHGILLRQNQGLPSPVSRVSPWHSSPAKPEGTSPRVSRVTAAGNSSCRREASARPRPAPIPATSRWDR